MFAPCHSIVELSGRTLLLQFMTPPTVRINCMFTLSGRTLRLQFMTPPTVHNNYCLHVCTQWSHSASAVYDTTHCSQ